MQRISYVTAQVNSRKKLDPDEIVDLKAFDPDYEAPAETEEDHEKVRARMKERQSAIARMLAAQSQADKGPEPG